MIERLPHALPRAITTSQPVSFVVHDQRTGAAKPFITNIRINSSSSNATTSHSLVAGGHEKIPEPSSLVRPLFSRFMKRVQPSFSSPRLAHFSVFFEPSCSKRESLY